MPLCPDLLQSLQTHLPTPLVLLSAPHLVETAPGAALSPSRLIRTQEQATSLVHRSASPVPSTSCNSRLLLGSQSFWERWLETQAHFSLLCQ